MIDQKQSNGECPSGCFYMHPSLPFDAFTESKTRRGYIIYSHRRGAFDVARFDQSGMREPLECGASDRTGSTFFMYR